MSLVADMRLTLAEEDGYQITGRVTRVVGLVIDGSMPRARVGMICEIDRWKDVPILAEVIGIKDRCVVLSPLGRPEGISVGAQIRMKSQAQTVRVGPGLLGRVLDSSGNPIDAGPPLGPLADRLLFPEPLNPLERVSIDTSVDIGVRSINTLLTVGSGQRMTVMASAGVGKSTLLSMMAKHSGADVRIVALIGERGREVEEFVNQSLRLGEESNIIVIASTSDQPPTLRRRAAFTAMTIAEYFRDQGKEVLMLLDSLTRVVMAQREVGLAAGELPASRGYPSSAFTLIPNLLERCGRTRSGSITGIFTTLFETDGVNDPISEAIKATADGHIILSREQAQRGHYPAIDVLQSVSRVMPNVVDPGMMRVAIQFRILLSTYQECRDLMALGAYERGTNPDFERALALEPQILEFLNQGPDERVSFQDSMTRLEGLVALANSTG
jgi:flagellum-specific ATP synthase